MKRAFAITKDETKFDPNSEGFSGICLFALSAKSSKLTKVIRKMIPTYLVICVLGLAVYFYAHHNWHPLPAGTTIDCIVVEKALRKLLIFRDGKRLKTYLLRWAAALSGQRKRRAT